MLQNSKVLVILYLRFYEHLCIKDWYLAGVLKLMVFFVFCYIITYIYIYIFIYANYSIDFTLRLIVTSVFYCPNQAVRSF